MNKVINMSSEPIAPYTLKKISDKIGEIDAVIKLPICIPEIDFDLNLFVSRIIQAIDTTYHNQISIILPDNPYFSALFCFELSRLSNFNLIMLNPLNIINIKGKSFSPIFNQANQIVIGEQINIDSSSRLSISF